MRGFLSNWILENLYSFFHITGTAAQDWIEYNGHEYYFQTESEDDDFYAARDFCQQNFGELASILDQNEQDFIAGNVSLETKIQPEKFNLKKGESGSESDIACRLTHIENPI